MHWLIDDKELPKELESLVKDLWALRLQKVQGRVAYESETDTEAPSSEMFSSQSESEATSASRSTRRNRRRREKSKVKEGSPKLIENFALLYISALLLRLPLTVADMHQWASSGQLLYYRAAREVPVGMRERLPPGYQLQLEPQDLLLASSLHAAVSTMLENFKIEFGMSPPALNIPLVLYRWVRELTLPLEVYVTTNRLAQLVDLTFKFLSKSGSNAVLQYPEGGLMAVVIVATKLLFPFDGVDRYAEFESDFSALYLDWKVWAKENAARRQNDTTSQSLSCEACFSIGDKECLSASEDKLDAYLDWYEHNLATEEIRERGRAGKEVDLRRAMFAMFPARNQTPRNERRRTLADGHASLDGHLRAVQSKVRTRPLQHAQPTGKQLQPIGSSYRRHRDASELSGVAKAFFKQAAELAGLSTEEMVKAVFAVERKMQKLEEQFRREDE